MHSLATRSERSRFPLSFAAALLATSSAHAVQGADAQALAREQLRVGPFELLRLALPGALTLDSGDPPGAGMHITPGSTGRFRFWNRDPAGPGGPRLELRKALSATSGP